MTVFAIIAICVSTLSTVASVVVGRQRRGLEASIWFLLLAAYALGVFGGLAAAA